MTDGPYLNGQLLLAMPGIGDPRFERAVILVCQHSATGAMGLVINKPYKKLTMDQLMEQLEVIPAKDAAEMPVYAGGPVEPARGFVVHSSDYIQPATLKVTETIGLTATLDILKDMSEGRGPRHALIALGYAGWSPGQLDREMTQHGWLTAPASDSLVFDIPMENRWTTAMQLLGIDIRMLSAEAGHA